MAWQGLKLNLRVSQKQILTPGLVQMVSVLALNRLELREMINQEMIANPVLEEQSEEPTQTDNYSDETFLKAETEKVPEKPEANPFDEFDVGTFFNQYLDTGGDGGQSQEREVSERPSFEKFLSSPSGLSDHLQWQLSVTDRAYILKSGKIFRKGRPDELSNDAEVRRVYLGDHFRLN